MNITSAHHDQKSFKYKIQQFNTLLIQTLSTNNNEPQIMFEEQSNIQVTNQNLTPNKA